MRSQQDPDGQRFTQLYRETRHDVLAYLVRRSRTTEEATDALAETYAVAWRRRDKVPDGEQARLWLFAVARNELRVSARRARAEGDLTTALANQLRIADAEPPPPRGDIKVIDQALEMLSTIDYEIVTLTAWEGLAPREIAAVLGLSPNVVRIRLHRARSNLRESLQERGTHIEKTSVRSATRAEAS